MNIAVWMLAGGILGWIAYSFLGFNEDRGVKVSVIIGTLGGLFGGKIIAPIFTTAGAAPADFSVSALFFAAAVAAISLAVGNFVHNRWGV